MKRLLPLLLLAAFWPSFASADALTIGYVQLAKDARYARKRTRASYLARPLGRPFVGAQVAEKEIAFVGAAIGIEFSLSRVAAKDAADMVSRVVAMNEQGVGFFLIDAPAEVVARVAQETAGRTMLLLNVSAYEDSLRQAQCQAHLLHVIPSHAMLMDALGQFLVSRKWRKVLVLEGAQPADKALSGAFGRSAKRLGLEIVDTRPFVLSNDPRERDRNNVALLTTGPDHDVVFVADARGEFARDVPYHSAKPRLVIGAEGLAPAAWHWAWERHGAPQLEGRFEKRAGRAMRGVDWAAWMAVKAVAEATLRSEDRGFAGVSAYLRGTSIIIDGFKGNRLSFRPWNGQLRQPVLLVTHNWVVERAPIKGFLHPSNNMDTLGFSERESECGR